MKTHVEKLMREEKDFWPESSAELADYIETKVSGQHDYGTCVYAASLAATAAFNYVAHKLGMTGFQASCADLDFVRRSRHIKGPFMLIKAEDALYPQHDLRGKLDEALSKWSPWLSEQAKGKINEGGTAHPDIMRHWVRLAYPNGDNTEAKGFFLAKADFLENEFTEKFVEKNYSEFKKFGILNVHIFRPGCDVAKAEKCEEGLSFRLDMPTSLMFTRNIHGIKVTWFVDTEKAGCNGRSTHDFDFKLLNSLLNRATAESVKTALRDYIQKAQGSGECA